MKDEKDPVVATTDGWLVPPEKRPIAMLLGNGAEDLGGGAWRGVLFWSVGGGRGVTIWRSLEAYPSEAEALNAAAHEWFKHHG